MKLSFDSSWNILLYQAEPRAGLARTRRRFRFFLPGRDTIRRRRYSTSSFLMIIKDEAISETISKHSGSRFRVLHRTDGLSQKPLAIVVCSIDKRGDLAAEIKVKCAGRERRASSRIWRRIQRAGPVAAVGRPEGRAVAVAQTVWSISMPSRSRT